MGKSFESMSRFRRLEYRVEQLEREVEGLRELVNLFRAHVGMRGRSKPLIKKIDGGE